MEIVRRVYRVAIAVVRRNGEYLVGQRPPGVHLGGYWEFPGGKSEPNESPEETAIRELYEECEVLAEAERKLGLLTHNYGDRVIELTPVLCRWISGEGRAIGTTDCRWVTLDDLRTLAMPEMNAAILAQLE